jgi:branched-chain amino acid transport system ATP-binding protein
MSEIILRIEGLNKSFGKFLVINDVDLNIKSGLITFLMGPNGAGKTTLINLVTSRLHPDSGKILFKGRDITDTPPHRLVKNKITRSFQVMNVFPRLTVSQNVELPILALLKMTRKWFSGSNDYPDVNREVEKILERTGLLDKKSVLAGKLSHGDQRLLELGIAIAPRPELCFLDEPTSGTNPVEGARVMELMKKLKNEENITFVVVEHDMDTVFSFAELIVVMHKGKILAEGKPDQIRENKEVLEIYLGEEVV